MLPTDMRVPAATLVETYSSSTQYLMHILSTNTRTFLHMHNSITFSHIHHFFSLIMVQIFKQWHFRNCTAKVSGKWNT